MEQICFKNLYATVAQKRGRMEQEKIGQFIAELRKEKGLTQKKLAEQLHITDKAISKWECGNSLPDHAVMLRLCEILGISVNELLSGERLSSMDYNRKAEKNIMTLMEENSKNQKKNKRQWITQMMVVLCLVVYFLWFINHSTKHSTENILEIGYFIDFAALHADILLTLIMLILAKKLNPFLNLFRYNVHTCDAPEEVQKAKDAASFAIKAVMLSGGICCIIYFVTWIRCITDVMYWGPNLAKMILGLFYSFLLSCILLILKERI